MFVFMRTETSQLEANDHEADEPDAAAQTILTTLGRWSPSVYGVMATLFVLAGLRIGLAPLHDNSFMTHLATGRIMLDTGSIPRTDPYSFTALGTPWTVQSWGASGIYGGLDAVFGLAGIRFLVAICCAALALATWRLTRRSASLLGRLVPAVLVLGIGSTTWVERPLLFGLLGLVAAIAAAEGDLDPRWLVPVMWLWVNTHGSFPLGIAALGVFTVGRWLDRQRADVEIQAMGWAVVGTLLGALNPLGPKLLLFPLGLLQNREAFEGIAEWGRPTWQTPGEWFFAVQLGLAVILMLARGRRWRVALPIVVFGGLALTSVRNVAPAAVVLLPGLVACLTGVGALRGDRRPRLLRPVAVALALLVPVSLAVSIAGGADTDLHAYPEASTTWMVDRGLLGTDTRVVSRDFVGNYWEARFGPDDVRVYMDDRVDMYPIGVIRDYTTLIRPSGDYQAVLDRARASAVLWDRDSELGSWLDRSDAWRVVHRDDTWLVAIPA